jgi:hypothetical protein
MISCLICEPCSVLTSMLRLMISYVNPMRHPLFFASDLKCQPNKTIFEAIQPSRKAQILYLVPCNWLNSINYGVHRCEALQFCLHHAWTPFSPLANDCYVAQSKARGWP